MLYDFHRAENAKKPKSVNATYFVIGTPEQTVRRPENGTHAPGDGDGDDEIMQSSPFTSSQAAQPDEAEQPTTLTEVRLVREEELPGRCPDACLERYMSTRCDVASARAGI